VKESGKKLKELAAKLNDKNINVVNSAIISLREEEPFYGAIGILTEVYDKTDDLTVKGLIRNFMNDIKESGTRPEIMAEIRKSHKAETICMLVSSCWQSGLDYSGFAADLIKLFLNGDYLVSLECFTVIEESLHNIPEKMKNEMIIYLEQNKENIIDEKRALINELISILG
jgi:hypothetical protein